MSCKEFMPTFLGSILELLNFGGAMVKKIENTAKFEI